MHTKGAQYHGSLKGFAFAGRFLILWIVRLLLSPALSACSTISFRVTYRTDSWAFFNAKAKRRRRLSAGICVI